MQLLDHRFLETYSYSPGDIGALRSVFSKITGEREPQPKRSWLISPTVDVLFVCGIAPWIMGLFVSILIGGPLQTAQPSPQQFELSIFFIVASLMIGEAHQFTSIIKYLRERGKPRRSWQQRLPFWFLFLFSTVMVGGPMMPDRQPWADTVFQHAALVGQIAIIFFPVVLMQHVCGQAKGIGLMYCGMNRFKFSKEQEVLLSAAVNFFVVLGACTIAKPFIRAPIFVPQADLLLLMITIGAQAAVILLALSLIRRGLHGNGWLPLGTALLWSNLALYILLPVSFTFYVWLFVPLLYHATQHWSVAWFARQKQVATEGRALTAWWNTLWESVRFVVPIQAVTLLVLFLPGFAFGGAVGPNSTLPLGLSMFVFYFHYFADRVVWRKS